MDDTHVTSASTSTAQLVERNPPFLSGFDKIVEELGEQKNKLTSAQSKVQNDVNEAKKHTQIEKNVFYWLTEVDNVLNEVEILERRIEKNKRSFCCCSNWIQRYQLSKKIEEKTLAIRQLVTSSAFHIMQFFESKSSSKAFNEIMEALKDDGVHMIRVWGMAGVGKTTLVAAVVNKVKEVQLFHKVITVIVSQHPDIGKIQDNIAALLDLKFEKVDRKEKAEELRLRLEKEEKVFIVLDDLWNELNLREIGIPFEGNRKGIKIILTTRNRKVCENVGSEVMVSLDVLDEDEACTLINMNASLDNAPQEVINKAEGFAKKYCGGLPLALVTMARPLRIKDDPDGSRLEGIENVLQTEIKENVYPSLEKSYNHLSETAKRCFVLCAIHLHQYSIDVEDVVRYALCLGFCQNDGSIEQVRSEVDMAIKELKDSCLLLEDDQKRSIKMHYMVSSVAKSIAAREDNGLVKQKNENGSDDDSSEEKLQIRLIADYYTERDIEIVERMRVVRATTTEDNQHFPFFLLNALKSLTNLLHGLIRSYMVSSVAKWIATREDNGLVIQMNEERDIEFSKRMRGVKVLSLIRKEDNQDLPFSLNALKSLTNLRSLELEGFKQLKDISALAMLTNLEILGLRKSEFQESVVISRKLKNLRVLDIRQCKFLLRFPPNVIRRLVKLEELYLCYSTVEGSDYVVRTGGASISAAILQELKFLPRLASLTLEVPSLHFIKNFVFPRVERYRIAINKCFETDPMTISSRFLEISKRFPLNVILELLWDVEFLQVSKIEKINHIKCLNDRTPENDAPVATILQNLKGVRIEDCENLDVIFQIEKEENQALSLSKLENLWLLNLPSLVYIWKRGRTPSQSIRLGSLKAVKIVGCGQLKSVFSFSVARSLVCLEELEINSCGELKQIVEESEEISPANMNSDNLSLRLPKLTSLEIRDCPRLEYVFPKFMAPKGLPRLQKLTLEELNELKQICAPEEGREENEILCPTLKDICLGGVLRTEFCEKINQLLGGHFLSSLEKLHLKNIHVLRYIWKHPSQILTLQHLSHVEVSNCIKLRNIFSVVVARNLPQLTYLKVIDCQELEHVVVEDGSPSPSLMAGQKPVYFPNLEEIFIGNCNKLRSLLPVTASCLPKLKKLQVQLAKNFREIFRHDIEANVTNNEKVLNEIQLPKLEELKLIHLPKLIEFTAVSHYFAFPDLISLRVVKCPRIRMRFSLVHDYSGGSYVHARIEKSPLLVDRNKVSSIIAIKPNESNKNIVWKRPRRIIA